jgi:hypothetical protein
LSPGESGELAPSPPTSLGLADAIDRALRDPERFHNLRVGAWKQSHQFTRKRHLEELVKVLEEAASVAAPRVSAFANEAPAQRNSTGLRLLKGVS